MTDTVVRDHVPCTRTIDDLKQQLAECRKERDKAYQINDGLTEEFMLVVCDRDKLRALVQRTLNYMRETDSTRTAAEVIADLVAGLEVTP